MAKPRQPKRLRHVVFDWSGTLVDDLPAVWRASNEVLVRAGLPEMSLSRFRAEFRLPFEDYYAERVPHIEMATLVEWFHEAFHEQAKSVDALPHAREFVEFVRNQLDCDLHVLSAVREDHFEIQAERNGLSQVWESRYLGVRDKRTTLRVLIQARGLDPAATLFIGDMQHDIEAAHEAGVASCGVLTGYNRLDQLREAEPDVLVEHLGELRRLLEQGQGDVSRLQEARERQAGDLPACTVGAAILDDQERVLMIRTHKWSDKWGIPGGKIRFGESIESSLRREIREETGLEVEDIQCLKVQECVHSTEYYKDAHFILLSHVCRARAPYKVVLNEEAQEYQWIPPNEALARLDLNQPSRELLQTWIDSHAS